jgi:nucleotidyltransferase/DNA polymerase involved in DNA repair
MRQPSKAQSITARSFSDLERSKLLKVQGVGPTVIRRLEEVGIFSLETLREYDASEIAAMVASSLGSSCWKNSPRAKQALKGAILLADNYVLEKKSRP